MTRHLPDYPPEMKAALADEKCMICEKLFQKHSQHEFEECMAEIVKKARTNLSSNP